MLDPKIAKKIAKIEDLIEQSREADAIIAESFKNMDSWVRAAVRAGLDSAVIPQITKLYRSIGKDLGVPKGSSNNAVRTTLQEKGYTRN